MSTPRPSRPIDSDDLYNAALAIGQPLADQLRDSLTGADQGLLHPDHGEGFHVTGGLFAIAAAINKLAEAVESLADKD